MGQREQRRAKAKAPLGNSLTTAPTAAVTSCSVTVWSSSSSPTPWRQFQRHGQGSEVSHLLRCCISPPLPAWGDGSDPGGVQETNLMGNATAPHLSCHSLEGKKWSYLPSSLSFCFSLNLHWEVSSAHNETGDAVTTCGQAHEQC